jgi:HEAT repeat protein
MKKRILDASAALIAVLMLVSLAWAEVGDPRNPNIERLRDKSADVRASAAKALGEQ